MVKPDDNAPLTIDNILKQFGVADEYGVADVSRLSAEDKFNLERNILELDNTPQAVKNALISFIDLACRQQQKLNALVTDMNKLDKAVRHDVLTGVFNRAGLVDALDAEVNRLRALPDSNNRHTDGGTVLYIDLKKFKPINDNYGHDAGDAALKHVAKILKETVRENDVVARIGGDEFVVIIQKTKADKMNDLCARVEQALTNMTFDYDGKTIEFSGRVGRFDIREGLTSAEIIHAADSDMLARKEKDEIPRGGGRIPGQDPLRAPVFL